MTRHRTHMSAVAPTGVWTLGGLAAALGGAALANHFGARAAERRTPPSGRFVETGGIRVHYRDEGTGAPVVLIHGNGVTLEDWHLSGVFDAARERYRVIAFDRPGFGHTRRTRTTVWTPSAQAALIRDALGRLSIERPILVGHSWGTMVALAMALDHPGSVAGLVLLSGYYFPTARPDVALFAPPAIPLLGDLFAHSLAPLTGRALLPGMAKLSFSPRPVDERFLSQCGLMLRPSQIRAASADAALMVPAAHDLASRYCELRLPVAILAGEGDRIVDPEAHAVRLAGAVGGATLTRFDGVGHMLHYARPHEVVASVEAVARRAGDPLFQRTLPDVLASGAS